MRQIPFNEESSLRVCDVIREQKPDIVVTHWSGSWHKDHQNCHLIVRDAIFYAGLETLARSRPAHAVSKLFYADNWEDASNFMPDTYLNIDAVCEKWLQACDFIPCGGANGFLPLQRLLQQPGGYARMSGRIQKSSRAHVRSEPANRSTAIPLTCSVEPGNFVYCEFCCL